MMNVSMPIRMAVTLLVALLVIGCTQIRATLGDLGKAETAIESEFGIDVEMEWEILNGELVSVGVVFSTLPAVATDLRQFVQRVIDLVNENLEQESGYIYIQFVSAGNQPPVSPLQ